MGYSKIVQRRIIFLVAILFLILIFWKQNNNQVIVEIGDCRFYSEIANNDLSRFKGLSNRPSLCSDCAMLFLFDSAQNLSFVMRNMNFPLDIIFIKNGKVINYYQNAPAEGSLPKKNYHSQGKADAVLEINSGLVEKCNIEIASQIIVSQ